MALTRININFIEDAIRAGTLLPWANDVAYNAVPSFAIGSDGTAYRSTTANGVDSSGNNVGPGAVNPVTDDTGVWEPFATAGATGGGRDQVFYENDQAVTEDYTISTGKNAMSAGPVAVGTTVDISQITSDGTNLTINTATAHGLVVGNTFTISGTTNYDGTYTVATVIDSDSLTAASAINTSAELTGTLTKQVIVTIPDGSTWAVV